MDPSVEYFEKTCQQLSEKYKGKSFPFKGKNAVRTMTIKKKYSEIAAKYFYKKALKTGGYRFAEELVIDICRAGEIDILKILR